MPIKIEKMQTKFNVDIPYFLTENFASNADDDEHNCMDY